MFTREEVQVLVDGRDRYCKKPGGGINHVKEAKFMSAYILLKRVVAKFADVGVMMRECKGGTFALGVLDAIKYVLTCPDDSVVLAKHKLQEIWMDTDEVLREGYEEGEDDSLDTVNVVGFNAYNVGVDIGIQIAKQYLREEAERAAAGTP